MISLDQIQAKFGIGKSESEDQDDHNQIDLELDKMLLRVRSVLYELYIVPTNKLDLEEIYGKKLFKCSRTGCESFFEGFTSSHDLEEHEAKHEQVCCSFEGCGQVQLFFVENSFAAATQNTFTKCILREMGIPSLRSQFRL